MPSPLPLTQIRSIPTGLRPEFDAITALEVEAAPLGGGNFGQNYVGATLNGAAPSLPFVVKVFVDDGQGSAQHGSDTIQKLQVRLRALEAQRRQKGEPSLAETPALLAAPQFYFEAHFLGRPVCGYGALRLDTVGYRPFSALTDGSDPAAMRAYLARPLAEPLQMAQDLAEGLRLFEAMDFVHGDINAENLFVNLAEAHVAIIDYDSGAVVEQPGDQPATWGKPGDWLAPEIVAQVAAGGARSRVIVDAAADAWAVGIGIHYLLFLHHPLIYLKDFGLTTLTAYCQANLWPQIGLGDPLYHQANDAVYQAYRQELTALPPGVQNVFDVLINCGMLSPEKRPNGEQWRRALCGVGAKTPQIIRFEADPPCVAAGCSVRLFWEAEDAARLLLSGLGDVTGRTEAWVTLTRDTSFTLVALGVGGQRAVARTAQPVRILGAGAAGSPTIPVPDAPVAVPVRPLPLPPLRLPRVPGLMRFGSPTPLLPAGLRLPRLHDRRP